MKCAKCGHTWREVPQAKVQTPTESAKAHPKPNPVIPPLPEFEFPPLPSTHEKPRSKSSRQGTQAAVEAPLPAPFTLKRIGKLLSVAIMLATLFFLLLSASFITLHAQIIKIWPQMQYLYIHLGLASDPVRDGIFLKNITSDRRYIDGAMQLMVQGEILSNAPKRQIIPPMAAEAVGADGRVIESWRIEPPAATIDPGQTVGFSSSILSPEQTVIAVNLSFIEQQK